MEIYPDCTIIAYYSNILYQIDTAGCLCIVFKDTFETFLKVVIGSFWKSRTVFAATLVEHQNIVMQG